MMVENKTQLNTVSELRQNLITQEWVIVATARGRRPDEFVSQENLDENIPHKDPFADPEESSQEADTLIYRDVQGKWTTRVFPNKYPALTESEEAVVIEDGPQIGMTGIGAHEIVVTRDPRRHLARLDVSEVAEVIDAYQDRYLVHMRSRSVKYVSIFHNHGMRAGASILHPHSQILALPVIPITIQSELDAVNQFYRKNHIDPFSVLLEHELNIRTRIVAENDEFVVLCPFAPKMSFEMWVMPKFAQSYFERITDAQKIALASVFREALRALDFGLQNPPFNFFIHTAPSDGWDYAHYRWYIDIMPRTSTIAGFELATNMEISTITPEDAAEFLRSQLKG